MLFPVVCPDAKVAAAPARRHFGRLIATIVPEIATRLVSSKRHQSRESVMNRISISICLLFLAAPNSAAWAASGKEIAADPVFQKLVEAHLDIARRQAMHFDSMSDRESEALLKRLGGLQGYGNRTQHGGDCKAASRTRC